MLPFSIGPFTFILPRFGGFLLNVCKLVEPSASSVLHLDPGFFRKPGERRESGADGVWGVRGWDRLGWAEPGFDPVVGIQWLTVTAACLQCLRQYHHELYRRHQHDWRFLFFLTCCQAPHHVQTAREFLGSAARTLLAKAKGDSTVSSTTSTANLSDNRTALAIAAVLLWAQMFQVDSPLSRPQEATL
eukprot:758057-Hanusia_phi.AAC.1